MDPCTMLRVFALVAVCRLAITIDMGPEYGIDYSGRDYNISYWNSSKNMAKDHYKAAALLCESYCLADENCCAWTYCPPDSGEPLEMGANLTADENRERCCLKDSVPPETHNAGHWSGLPPRAIVNYPYDNSTTAQCLYPRPYPGPNYTHPLLHHSPDCLHDGGWHDVAGALTLRGRHHVWQGCPAALGWSHAVSEDLVHWADNGIHNVARDEKYEGMESDNSPCSGFVAVDDDNQVCAGFRQCNSNNGTTGLNPKANKWDVPLELRCAKNAELTSWGPSEFILPIYYYRALPYDPARPWKDDDGKWYFALSTDGCNATTRAVPCAAGGQLDLYRADSLHGPWDHVGAMFTTNTTMRGFGNPEHEVTGEFVTSGYFGGLNGDPDGGMTRVVTQNRAGASYWVGSQSNGGKFTPYWDKPGAVGYYDYGELTMARTLGSDPNQVLMNGRKVLIGWIGGTPASQSLARDLSLSKDYELLQQFVPELAMLRQDQTSASLESARDLRSRGQAIAQSQQVEVYVSARVPTDDQTYEFGVDVLCLRGANGANCSRVYMSCSGKRGPGCCEVGVIDKSDNNRKTSAPLDLPEDFDQPYALSAIVDHQIIEVIFNNRTAMVVYVQVKSAMSDQVVPYLDEANFEYNIDSWKLDSI